MKILIIGASGFTGSYLANIFSDYQVIKTSRDKEGYVVLDISDNDNVIRVMKHSNPDIVCIPAYLTNLDYCEEHPKQCQNTNVLGIKNVVNVAGKHTKIVFYSSDAVFKGNKGPYSEDDKTDPVNEYGRQKLEAEKIVRTHTNHLILRTCSIYGWDPRNMNFVARLIRSISQGREFKAPEDQFYTPTYVKDLAEATRFLIEKTGTYHVAGDEFLSRYLIAEKVCGVFELNRDNLVKTITKNLEQKAPRAQRGGLKNSKIKKLGFKFHSLKDGLREMRNQQVLNISGKSL